jgi:hypothetical protein
LRKIRKPPPTEGKDRLIPFLASLLVEDQRISLMSRERFFVTSARLGATLLR